MLKAEILLHTTLDQGDIQTVDAKTQTDSEVYSDLKPFYACLMTGNINTLRYICDDYILSMKWAAYLDYPEIV